MGGRKAELEKGQSSSFHTKKKKNVVLLHQRCWSFPLLLDLTPASISQINLKLFPTTCSEVPALLSPDREEKLIGV